MTRFWSLILALALPVAACQQQGEQAGTTEATPAFDAAAVEQTIRTNADAYAQAALAGDTEALVSMYSDDAILQPPGMPRSEGIDAVRTAYQQMYAAGNPTSASLAVQKVMVSESGDMAVEVGTYSFSAPAPDGAEVTDNGKYIAVWKPTADGSWKIAVDTWNSDGAPGAAPGAAGTSIESTGE